MRGADAPPLRVAFCASAAYLRRGGRRRPSCIAAAHRENINRRGSFRAAHEHEGQCAHLNSFLMAVSRCHKAYAHSSRMWRRLCELARQTGADSLGSGAARRANMARECSVWHGREIGATVGGGGVRSGRAHAAHAQRAGNGAFSPQRAEREQQSCGLERIVWRGGAPRRGRAPESSQAGCHQRRGPP